MFTIVECLFSKKSFKQRKSTWFKNIILTEILKITAILKAIKENVSSKFVKFNNFNRKILYDLFITWTSFFFSLILSQLGLSRITLTFLLLPKTYFLSLLHDFRESCFIGMKRKFP